MTQEQYKKAEEINKYISHWKNQLNNARQAFQDPRYFHLVFRCENQSLCFNTPTEINDVLVRKTAEKIIEFSSEKIKELTEEFNKI